MRQPELGLLDPIQDVSDMAREIAMGFIGRYLTSIENDGQWRALDEQQHNPRGYFGALREAGLDPAEFYESLGQVNG